MENQNNLIKLLHYLVEAYKVQIHNGSASNGLATAHYHKLIDKALATKALKNSRPMYPDMGD